MFRERQDNSPVYPLFIHYQTEAGNGTLWVRDVTDRTKYCLDIVTPGFKALIDRGVVINNPALLTWSRTVYPEGSRDVKWSNQPEKYNRMQGHVLHYLAAVDGFSPPPAPFLDPDLGSLKTTALGKMDRADEQLGEDVAEIRSLIKLLRDPLSVLLPATYEHYKRVDRKLKQAIAWRARWAKNQRHKPTDRQLRRLRRRDARRVQAEAWQISRNVILPTMNSALAVGRIIADWNKTHPPVRRSEHAGTMLVDSTSGEWSVHGRNYVTYFHRRRVKARANLLYQVNRIVCNGIVDKAGLRLKDLPATMWAICPYSYLINRMIDIQSVINALVNMSDPFLSILAASTSVRTETTLEWGLVESSNEPYIINLNAGTCVSETSVYERNVWYPSYEDIWHPKISGVDKLTLAQLTDLVTNIMVMLRRSQSL